MSEIDDKAVVYSVKKGFLKKKIKNSYSPKNNNKTIIFSLLLVSILVLVGFLVFYNSQAGRRLEPKAVIENSTKYLADGEFDKAYKLLKVNDGREEFKSNIDYYVLIARAAVATNRLNEAKEYAKKGANIYMKSKNNKPENGFILESIISGTYVEQQYLKNKDNNYTVPKNDSDKQDFQG